MLEQGIARGFYGAVAFDAAAELEERSNEKKDTCAGDNAIFYPAGLAAKYAACREHEICSGEQERHGDNSVDRNA